MLEEQQQEPTTEETPAEPSGPATDDDLLAAAREATSKLGQGVEPSEGEIDATTPTAATEEEPRWMRLMKEREKGMAEREAAQKAADDAIARANAEATRIVEEARKRAEEEVSSRQKAWQSRFATDPEAALRELGDPGDVANTLIDMNSPQGKLFAKLRAELAETKEKAGTADKVKEEFESWKKQQEEEKLAARYEQAKQAFLGAHANQEKAPYLHARYDADEIIQKADSLAREWQKANLQFDYDDIAQYLEHEAKKKLSALPGLNPAPSSRGAAPAAGNAPKVQANGSRTITAAAGSERRAAVRPFKELNPEEQDAELRRVASEAWRQHSGKT